MGIGAAGGEERAKEATKRAISSPLLEVSIDGAEHVLVNVTGGKDLSMTEAEDASSVIRQAANTNVDITFGMAIDETLNDEIRVTVIATGIDRTKQDNDKEEVTTQTQAPAQPASQTPVQPRVIVQPQENAAPVSETSEAPVNNDPFQNWNEDLGNDLEGDARRADFNHVKKPTFSVQDDNLSNVDDGDDDLSTPAFFKNRRK